MKEILILAYKLLVNDKGKYTALLVGTTFSVFLIVQMTSSFAGILTKASATVINVGANIWVMDPGVNTVLNSIPMPDYVLDAVRSINGVKYAVPLYSGGALVKLHDGTYQPVMVVGLDDASLFGRPELSGGKYRRHLCGKWICRSKGRGISEAEKSEARNGIRTQ